MSTVVCSESVPIFSGCLSSASGFAALPEHPESRRIDMAPPAIVRIVDHEDREP